MAWYTEKKRFESITNHSIEDLEFIVVKDTETGVRYLVTRSRGGCGVTVMLDKDGKPLME